MAEVGASRYWCHMCSQTVNPIMDTETINCPICQSGFVEEMESATATSQDNDRPLDFGLGGSDSDRAMSLWAPILLGMMGNLRHHGDEPDDHHPDEDQELESIIRRRRRRMRNSAAVLQLLQGIRAGLLSQSGNSEADNEVRDGGRRVILINPFNQTIIVQGSPNAEFQNHAPIGSFGDYFIGPGLDLLLQRLAESDPNRYGTPPAQKEAIDALPTVQAEEVIQCSVCLDECEVGAEVKEMPCRHKFHSSCIVPWLELHSSCPVCRYQLPADESKLDQDVPGNNDNHESVHSIHSAGDGEDSRNEIGRRFPIPLLWPLSSLFTSPTTETGGGNSSSLPPPPDA